MSPPVLETAWAMPNPDTLAIPQIDRLVRLFAGKGDGWADLFCGRNCPAQHQNDLKHRGEAANFLGRFADESLQGIILDQIGRLRLTRESCDGMVSNTADTWKVKDVAAKKIMPGGLAVCCGWNSNGLGEKRGFELIHVLAVRHGGDQADTIVTVEIKVPYQAADDLTDDELAALRSQGQRGGGERRPKTTVPAAKPASGPGDQLHGVEMPSGSQEPAPTCQAPNADSDGASRIEAKLEVVSTQTLARLKEIQASLATLVQQRTIKEFYTTDDLAKIFGKAEYTVREWCRLRRIKAKKTACGRGGEKAWRISHEELVRIQNEGLLPIPTKY